MQTLRSLPALARGCLATLAALALICWLGPFFIAYAPHSPDWTALGVAPGTRGHWFGTDAIGRDVLARTLAGGRLSLTIGLLASVVALLIGLGYGAIAGLAGGRVERA
ncbi:MAG: peptide ABC transporter permease, partial [Pseudoxanthomonas sp.]